MEPVNNQKALYISFKKGDFKSVKIAHKILVHLFDKGYNLFIGKSNEFEIPGSIKYSILQKEDKSKIWYIITIGGDGSILYAINEFNSEKIPPIISFSTVHLNRGLCVICQVSV